MLISIIGSNSFLANSIGKYLNNSNIRVNVFGRSKPHSYQYENFFHTDLDINTFPFSECARSDVVMYLAAVGAQSEKQLEHKNLFYINTYFPIMLSEFFKEEGSHCKFITFGSYHEIGDNAEDISYSEKDVVFSDLITSSNYSRSKRLLSRYISSLNESYSNIHFILPTIYGETEQKHRLLPYILSSILNKKNIHLTSGEQIRQYLHEEDFAKVLLDNILNNNISSGIYNFPAAETLSVKDIALKVLNYFNLPHTHINFNTKHRLDLSMKILKLKKSVKHDFELRKIEETIPKYITHIKKLQIILFPFIQFLQENSIIAEI
jgi:nucleoside-diphosphate-sugar epimerase